MRRPLRYHGPPAWCRQTAPGLCRGRVLRCRRLASTSRYRQHFRVPPVWIRQVQQPSKLQSSCRSAGGLHAQLTCSLPEMHSVAGWMTCTCSPSPQTSSMPCNKIKKENQQGSGRMSMQACCCSSVCLTADLKPRQVHCKTRDHSHDGLPSCAVHASSIDGCHRQ